MRTRLPNRRASLSFNLEVAGLHYIATISCFPNGRLGEIFIGNHKSGSGADVAARDAAIACSLALQHGADVETIRRALTRNRDGSAGGVLGAVLDAIAAED
jgi:ribonucleoside-diphosphate reductase alpha chain